MPGSCTGVVRNPQPVPAHIVPYMPWLPYLLEGFSGPRNRVGLSEEARSASIYVPGVTLSQREQRLMVNAPASLACRRQLCSVPQSHKAFLSGWNSQHEMTTEKKTLHNVLPVGSHLFSVLFSHSFTRLSAKKLFD